jgi:hypothetical protein
MGEQLKKSRRFAIATALMGALLASLTFTAGRATAFRIHPLNSTFLVPGSEEESSGVAVNQETHAIYAVNGSFSGERGGGLYRYDPGSANPARLISATEFSMRGVAIDNSAGSRQGYIYAFSGRQVRQYTPAAVPTGVTVSTANLPANGSAQGGGLPSVVNSGFFAKDVAVDENGDLLVADLENNSVDKFTPTGTFVAQFASQDDMRPAGLDVAPSGEIFVAGNGLFKLLSSGECSGGCAAIALPGEEIGDVAVEPSGNLLATLPANVATTKQPAGVVEYQPNGTLVSTSSFPELLKRPRAIAIDHQTEDAYVVDEGFNRPVGVLGPLLIVPDAITGSPTGFSDHGVVLHGVVNPDGGGAANCVFQYIDDAGFKAKGFGGAQSTPCSPAGPYTAEADQVVEASVEDLAGGTKYHYRLLASNSQGSHPGEDVPFETLGPRVVSQRASNIMLTSADLSGSVNPRGEATTYFFQVVSEEAFAMSGYADASEVPPGGESIGAGTGDIEVAQSLGGLGAGETYHFRLVATGHGSGVGPDETFTTQESSFAGLPDGRAYEQATPVLKNGTSAQGETNTVEAAANGAGVTYYATAGLPGGVGAQQFPSYLSTRKADGTGWSTQGLLPPATTGPRGKILNWTEDLEGVYSYNKLLGLPVTLLLKETGGGSLTELASDEVSSTAEGTYGVSGSSADGDEVYFEDASAALTPGAEAGRSNAYLWNRESGTLVLAGVLNNGLAPPEGSFAGPYDWFRRTDTKQAPKSLNYYTKAEHVISADGKYIFFTAAGSGRVYMRKNPLQGQSPLDGDGRCADQSLACTVEISGPEDGIDDTEAPASFVGATADGSKAFFLSSGRLTADARVGAEASSELYEYDTDSETLRDVAPDSESPSGTEVLGVLGMSRDGSYVYFAANGVLTDSPNPEGEAAAAGDCRSGSEKGSCNVYLAHGSTISFVARLRPLQGQEEVSDERNWAPTALLVAGQAEATARVSADGKTLLFTSSGQITAYKSGGFSELYRYRADGGPLSCISCNPTNEAPHGAARLQALRTRFSGPNLPFGILTRNLSASGNRIFFDSPDKLVSADDNEVNDVYEWEADGSGSCTSSSQEEGCIYLISTGTGEQPAYFGDADESGGNVFFFTGQQLVGQDKDELVDVYDARIDGGIGAQNPPAPPPPCEAEACRATFPSSPIPFASGSSSFNGPGNPEPKRKRTVPKRHREKPQKHHHKGRNHGKTHKGGSR